MTDLRFADTNIVLYSIGKDSSLTIINPFAET